jgi:DMSO reductase family type II enzyme heme b subunit
MIARLLLALAVLGVLAAPAAAQPTITAVRVAGAGPIVDPAAAAWKDARPLKVPMLPQTVTPPNHPDPAVKELTVRAVHNGGWIAFLIEWPDATQSDRLLVDSFASTASATRSPCSFPSRPRRRRRRR